MTLLRCCCLLLLLGVYTSGLAQTCPAGHPRVAPNERYSITEPVTGQRVVTDTTTGLMWKQCSEGHSGAACTGTATSHTWTAALTLANSASHAGFNDWRLPNIEELRGLVETGCFSPSINTTVFPATVSGSYWSSTTRAPSASAAWVVIFSDGLLSTNGKFFSRQVRLVRGGQWLDTFSAEADAEPDGFSLAPQSGVATSSVRTSDPITVAGLTTVTGIGVSGASDSTYSIEGVDGGAYTSQPGAVANGNVVRVRHTSAAAANTTTTTTLSIGGVTADFVSTTATVPGAPTIGTATAGDAAATVAFTAPASDGGSAITGYTATSSPDTLISSDCTTTVCTVTGLTNGTAYTFTVTATNGIGTGDPSAASNSVTPRANQAITFGTAPAIAVGGTGTVTATGGASGNPVTFTSQTTGVCTVSGTNGSTVTGVSVGTCTIAANQLGSAAFNAAPEVTQNFAIGQGSQTISFGTAPTIAVGGTGTVTATGGASGNPVTFTSQTTGVCTVSGTNGSTVTGVAAGTCTIAANQAGNANYEPAPQQTLSFSIGKANQATLTAVASPTAIAFNGTSTLGTTGGSGTGAVSYAVTAGATFCSVTGTTLTGTGVGTCTVTATKAADTNFNAATATVDVTVVGVPTPPTNVRVTVSGTTAQVNWNPPESNGGVPITSYRVVFQPGGAFCEVTGNPPPSSCAVSGLQPGVNYTVLVTASNGVSMSGPGIATTATAALAPEVIPVDQPWALILLGGLIALLAGRGLRRVG